MRPEQYAVGSLSLFAWLWFSCNAAAPVRDSTRPSLARTPSAAPARPVTAPTGTTAPPPEAKPREEPPPPAQLEPDGNGLVDSPGEGEVETGGQFERVGRHWGALQRICDMQPHGDALLLAHATRPLGWDGATLTRYLENPSNPKRPFELAFDWNRSGQPSKGGGAGQGFLRIRSIEGRLYVPDADPPYLGLGLNSGIEGYLFESDANGKFAAARPPRKLPPRAPAVGGPGAAVLPRAYHDFDIIRYRGLYYASIGANSPDGQARGALLVSNDGIEFEYEGADYPDDTKGGVWRLTYMVRYEDRLYSGIESLGIFDPNDYLVWELPKGESRLSRRDAHAVRATPTGGKSTLRWYADQGKLYWITRGAEGTELRVTADGEHWQLIELPEGAGPPSDLARYKNSLVVLTENALWSLEGDQIHWVADAPRPSPFRHDDHYCAAPLAVFNGRLYAGGQKRGYLYRLSQQ